MKNEDFMLKMKEIANNDFGTINYAIYDAILKHTNEIANMSLEQFAKLCYTSKPSILKFCYKIGLSGYSELKFIIKNNIDAKESFNKELTVVKEFKEIDKFRLKYTNLNKKYLDLLLENYDQANDKIQTLVEKIINADVVYIFCANLAYYASKNFLQKVRWLKKNIILENDINLIESYITQMPKNSVTIIISLSGLNPHMLQISNWLGSEQYSFAISGNDGKLIKQTTDYLSIPEIENELWDNYSLRAQYVANFFDFLFVQIEKQFTLVK
ncbi:MurR/RpiR family transcriptional regulator [Mesoplasma seiffertii]|uniref:MurR/RpiR family transcriptional regulator n=1 Tax=Mesoplasma seiffertii TaxID=28224 RepID=UPI00047A5853|nr:MurR/RpiR family transcriptional regulator [Mesoplasma seiffertii]